MKKLYSLKEVADNLGVSRQYIWILIQLNKIKASKVGGRYIISQKEFDRIKVFINKRGVK